MVTKIKERIKNINHKHVEQLLIDREIVEVNKDIREIELEIEPYLQTIKDKKNIVKNLRAKRKYIMSDRVFIIEK